MPQFIVVETVSLLVVIRQCLHFRSFLPKSSSQIKFLRGHQFAEGGIGEGFDRGRGRISRATASGQRQGLRKIEKIREIVSAFFQFFRQVEKAACLEE